MDRFQTNTFSYTTQYAKKKRKKKKKKEGTSMMIFAEPRLTWLNLRGAMCVLKKTKNKKQKQKKSFARVIACCIFQCSLKQTLILVQFSVFIDLLRVVLRYMDSYLTLLMSNINNRNKQQLIQINWNAAMLYSQHFTFHGKLLVNIVIILYYKPPGGV